MTLFPVEKMEIRGNPIDGKSDGRPEITRRSVC